MRRTLKVAVALAATAAATFTMAAGTAIAGPPSGAPATGVQLVTYSGNGYTCTDSINRSASGIVTEWRGPAGCNPDVDGNSTLLFKPTSAAKPASCDQTNIIKSTVLTYGVGFGPYTVTSGYSQGSSEGFWKLGQAYLVCFYPLAYEAAGSVDYTAYGLARSATFDLTTDGYGVNEGGTFSYSDSNSSWYSVAVSCVDIDSATGTAFFGGQVTSASDSSWVGNFLYGKVTAPDQLWGSFVAADPCATLGNADPADGPFTATSGSISVAPIIGG